MGAESVQLLLTPCSESRSGAQSASPVTLGTAVALTPTTSLSEKAAAVAAAAAVILCGTDSGMLLDSCGLRSEEQQQQLKHGETKGRKLMPVQCDEPVLKQQVRRGHDEGTHVYYCND